MRTVICVVWSLEFNFTTFLLLIVSFSLNLIYFYIALFLIHPAILPLFSNSNFLDSFETSCSLKVVLIFFINTLLLLTFLFQRWVQPAAVPRRRIRKWRHTSSSGIPETARRVQVNLGLNKEENL